jgi:hypothetical protein
MTTAEQATLSIEDRFAIQDLVSRYSVYVDTFQIEPLMSLWVTDDPFFDETKLGAPRASGLDSIRRFFVEDVFDKMEAMAHLTENPLIDEVTEKGARGTCQHFFEGIVKGGGTIRVTASYDDVYERTSGGWKFRSRTVTPYTRSLPGEQ